MRIQFITAILALQSLPAFAATISVLPANQNIVSGQTFTVDIAISDVTDLYAYQFDLGFDPSVIEATGTTEGPFLAAGGATFFIVGALDNFGGNIGATGDTLLTAVTGVSGSGVLARATFRGVGVGTSSINLFNVTLLDSSLSGIAPDIQSGGVIADAGVPEPSALLLLGGGLGLILGLRRRID